MQKTLHIDEYKQIEKELAKNEQRYRFLINATTSIHWTTNGSGGFIRPQPAWEKYTGQPWPAYKGFGWTKMIHPGDVDRILEVWKQACQTLSLYETWGRVWNAKLNQYRYFEVRATPILNSDGSLFEWVGIIIDTTKHKTAEIGLREATDRLNQAQQMAKLGHWDWEISTDTLTWSDEVYNIFGQDRHTFQSTLNSFESCLHPEDHKRYLLEREAALERNQDIDIEYRICLPDGSERYVHEIAKIIRSKNGELARVTGTVQEITKYKVIEEDLRRYENIISSTPDGIAFLDKQYKYVIINDSYEKFSGVKKEQLVGKTVAEYLGQEKFEQLVKPNFDKCLLGHIIKYQDWFKFPALGNRFVEVTYFPYRDRQNHIIGVVANTRDITSQKLADEAIKSSYQQSELRSKISKLFLTSLKPQLFIDIVGKMLVEFKSQYGYFGYMDSEGDLVCPVKTHTPSKKQFPFDKKIVLKEIFWGDLIQRALDERQLIRLNQTLPSDSPKGTLRNAMVAPLMVEGELIGLMAVANKSTGYSGDNEDHMVSLSDFIAPIVKIFLEKEHAKEQLESNACKLKEMNTALKVLLDNREEEKKGLSDGILQSFEQIVYPYFEKIEKYKKKEDIITILKIIESNVHSSLSNLEKSSSRLYQLLTPTELQVADLVKVGRTSKDIAAIMNISPRTVFFHRENIRKKLKLYNKKISLRSALLSS